MKGEEGGRREKDKGKRVGGGNGKEGRKKGRKEK